MLLQKCGTIDLACLLDVEDILKFRIALVSKVDYLACHFFGINVLAKERFLQFVLKIDQRVFLINLIVNVAVVQS